MSQKEILNRKQEREEGENHTRKINKTKTGRRKDRCRQRREKKVVRNTKASSVVGRGGEKISGSWAQFSEPEAFPGPCISDFPNSREAQGSLCGRRLFAPDPDLMMPLIWYLNSGFAAFWAGPGVCLPSPNLHIGLNFGHFDGPVIGSQFFNFQSPPPSWELKRDFKDPFDNVHRLHIFITIFFTRSLCLMQSQMF